MNVSEDLEEFDPVKFLWSESDIEAFLNEALESGCSQKCLAKCIEDAALAKGLIDFAKKLEIPVKQLYEHLHTIDTPYEIDMRVIGKIILEGLQNKNENIDKRV